MRSRNLETRPEHASAPDLRRTPPPLPARLSALVRRRDAGGLRRGAGRAPRARTRRRAPVRGRRNRQRPLGRAVGTDREAPLRSRDSRTLSARRGDDASARRGQGGPLPLEVTAMLVGHFAVAFAAKQAEPKLSLGTLVVAALLADAVAFALMFAGLEGFHVVARDATSFNASVVADLRYSHSLAIDVLLATLFAAAHFVLRRDRRSAALVFA